MLLSDYEAVYYRDSRTGRAPVRDYILALPRKDRAKIDTYIALLVRNEGYLDEPYAKKVWGAEFRELIVDFARNRHRIFYFTFTGRKIVLFHAFLKKTPRTPTREIERGTRNYVDFLSDPSYMNI